MKYLVTGGAGFIGSNLVEALLERGDEVVVLDDLSTGKRANIEPFMDKSGFTFIHGSITNPETCAKACEGMDYVLHHAAMVSVPMSIKEPLTAQEVNVTGSVNIFLAAKNAGIKCVVSASSTSVYGNSMVLPNVEPLADFHQPFLRHRLETYEYTNATSLRRQPDQLVIITHVNSHLGNPLFAKIRLNHRPEEVLGTSYVVLTSTNEVINDCVETQDTEN